MHVHGSEHLKATFLSFFSKFCITTRIRILPMMTDTLRRSRDQWIKYYLVPRSSSMTEWIPWMESRAEVRSSAPPLEATQVYSPRSSHRTSSIERVDTFRVFVISILSSGLRRRPFLDQENCTFLPRWALHAKYAELPMIVDFGANLSKTIVSDGKWIQTYLADRLISAAQKEHFAFCLTREKPTCSTDPKYNSENGT